MSNNHLVIIGAGIIGLCNAYYAKKAGFKVTLIERSKAEHEGTSYGNAGMIVPSHFVPLSSPGIIKQGFKWMLNPESPFYVKPRLEPSLLRWAYQFWRHASPEHAAYAAPLLLKLNLESKQLYEQLEKELEPFGLEKKGLVMLCNTEEGFEKEQKLAKDAKKLGLNLDVLAKEALQTLEPNLDMNAVGGVHYHDDAHMNPKQVMLSLRNWLERENVAILWSTDVKSIKQENKSIKAIETSQGSIEADYLLVAAGIWSSELLADLNLNLPMQAGKGYSMLLENPPQAFETPAILSEAKVAVSPLKGAVRFGGTMEIAGTQEKINPSRVTGIIKSVKRYFPSYQDSHFENTKVWYGFRPCSPDGLPFVGKSTQHRNLFIATGHAMLGLSLAPITAKMITSLLNQETPSKNLEALKPDRYA